MGFAWFAFTVCAGMLAACQLGYWVGRRKHATEDATTMSHAMTWQAAVLAMAGLLIGFAFAMAADRFEARKQIILEEANAIETTYLRTRLIDEGPGQELRALVRSYRDARVALFDAGVDQARAEASERATAALQAQIWSRAVAAARTDRESEIVGLLLESANAMFEGAAKRRALRDNPVPGMVLAILILVSGIAMTSIGYTCGLAGRILAFGMVVMPLLVAGVIVLVFDIGNPRVGLVRVGDQSILRLKQNL